MHDYPAPQPPQTYLTKPVAEADGLVITAFVLAWIFPPAGAIMGHVSRAQARRRGLYPSALSTWAVALGWIWTAATIGWIVLWVTVLAAAMSQTGNGY